MKKSIKENKVDDMLDDIQSGTGWASYDYILNSKHSPLSKTERVRLLIKLAKAGILADEDKLNGKEQHKNQIPNQAFMSLQDLERKYKGRTNPNNKIKEDEVTGGLADGKTLQDIANKHKVDIDDLTKEFQKGIKVEKEHTTDNNIASEIARDHLMEDPKYYTKLATIENKSVNEASNLGNKDVNHLQHHLNGKTEKEVRKFIDDVYKFRYKFQRDNMVKLFMLYQNNKISKRSFVDQLNSMYNNESLKESINIKDYEPVHGTYGFDKLAKMADTKNTIKLSKGEFNDILKVLKKTGTDILKKTDKEEYWTIYSLGNDYNLVRLQMKNEGLTESKKIGDEIKTIKGKSLGVIVKQGKSSKNKKVVRLLKLDNKYKIQVGNIVYDVETSNPEKEYNTYLNESINEDVKDDLMSGGMKTWWKYDKKDVMSFIYWLQRQIPPTGPKFDTEWKKIAAQLQKKHPAPKGEYEKIINESSNIETITKKEWNKLPKDYKTIGKNKVPYMLKLGKDGATHLVPVKIVDESINEATSISDMFRELQSFYSAGVNKQDIEKSNLPVNKKKNVNNNKEFKNLIKSWKYGEYDEDPGILVQRLRGLLENSVNETNYGYKDSDASYIKDHKDEYKIAKSIFKKVGGNEIKFYDELELLHDKLGHPKYMIWLSNALRGYKVDMYKDPKIKNKAEAEEALYLLSK